MRSRRPRIAVGLAAVTLALAAGAGAAGETLAPEYPTPSPDGAQLAWSEGVGWKIWTAGPDGSNPRVLAAPPTSEGISDMHWTSQGLLVDSNFAVWLLRPNARPRRLQPAGFTFAVGGTRVGSGQERAPGPYIVTDVVTGARWRLGSPKVINNNGTLSPNGSRAAWTTTGGIDTARLGAQPHRLAAKAACPAWSPDGRSIAFMRFPADLRVISASGGRSRLLAANAGGCQEIAWSPDSRRIAYSGPRGVIVVDVAAAKARRLPAALGSTFATAWSPDGDSLYVNARPAVDEKRKSNCLDVWRLDATTLSGAVVVRGCP